MPSLPKKSKQTSKSKSTWKATGVSFKSLQNLGQKIKNHFKWKHEPREFQVEAIKAQLQCKDVLIHAGTGSGKTFVAAGPFAHESAKGKVTFMVSPLIALQNEQVETFTNEYGLEAIAVNSAHGGCTKEIMAEIVSGKWQIVVISPEMMLSKRFTKNVLRDSEMRERILAVVVDEAHVVSHWGTDFRKKYGSLGVLRALLPKGTPMVAMSATLPPRVRNDVLRKLQYNLDDYTYLNIGNDRPNVSIVVRAIQNPLNTFSDLDFVIPSNSNTPDDIPKTFIYADNITTGGEIMEHLYSVSPEDFRKAGVIRTYSAAFSKKYRHNVMELFRAGKIRVLICTDAAGMGCNIPDIELVVQWKLPSTLSAFVQRAGRAARGFGRTGLAVLLAEKSAYDLDLEEAANQIKNTTKKKAHVREVTEYPKAKDKSYAIKHGVLRGAYGGETDTVDVKTEPPLNIGALDEGLYCFVQTLLCRRSVLTRVYENKKPDPTVPCCDLCNPELLDKTRPAAPIPSSNRRARNAAGAVDNILKESIVSWRKEIWSRDFGDSLLGPSVVLSSEMMEALSSFGPIKELDVLKNVIGGWLWFGKYGEELLTFLKSLEIAPKKPKPTKPRAPRGEKRGKDEEKAGEVRGEEERSKRLRSETTSSEIVQTPTPVTGNPCPTPVRNPTGFPQSTPSRPSPIYPFAFHYQRQTLPQTPLAYNPYAALVTPSSSSAQSHPQSQVPYTPIPFPYSYYYPHNTSSSSYTPSSHQGNQSWYPKPPPPPPPST